MPARDVYAGLGMFQETPEYLRRAIRYLEDTSGLHPRESVYALLEPLYQDVDDGDWS